MKLTSIAALALGVCVSALSISAQVTTGIPAFGTFSSGPDVINIGNLNTHLDIPVINKTGRGLNFTYDLTYDSSVWYPVTSSGSHSWMPSGGWGWGGQVSGLSVPGFAFNPSSVISYTASVAGALTCGINTTYVTTTYNNFTYFDKTGTPHGFGASGTFTTWNVGSGGNPTGCPTAGPVPSTLQNVMATDGSGLTLYWLPSPFAYVVQKNGTKITPQLVSTSGTVTSSTYNNQDLNGNYISGSGGVYTDTTGNTALTATTNSSAHTVTLAFANTSGGTSSYVINYSSYNIQTNFGCTSPTIAEYSASAVYLPSSISLPDGSSQYEFTYEATPGYSGYTTGRIASVTLPSGNKISYAYTGGSHNGITCADGSTSILTRTLSADAGSAAQTWAYTRSAPGGAGTSHTVVEDGLTNNLLYDFVAVNTGTAANYYETHRKVYNGAASGTPVLERYTCYNGSSSSCTTTAVSTPLSQIDTYETLDGAETHGSTVTFDTTYGNETEAKTYDFSTSATSHGTLLRDEKWTYGYSVASLPTADKVYDGSSNLIGETTYGYDQTTPTATSGVPNHTTPSSTPGNLTTETVYASPSQSYALTATYYDTGSIHTSLTPNGTTTLGYDSSFVYNTSTSLPTPSSGVALSSSATFDTSYTGLPLTSHDLNSQETQVTQYDTSLRPTVIKSPANGEAVIYYNPYASGSPLQTQQLIYQSSSVYTNTVTQYDGYGRPSRVEVTNGQTAEPFYQTDTCYDANGNANFQANTYQGQGFAHNSKSCGTSGTTTTYDVLGRVTQVENANSETRTYQYTARAVESTDEKGVKRISQVDGLGRPTIVCEVTATTQGSLSPTSCGTDISGMGFVTTYTYTPSTGTTTTSQQATPTPTYQTRTFVSDWLGRPTSVTEPESGTTTYSYAYNTTGLLVTRNRPAPNQTSPTNLIATTTQYDSLGRVVSIAYGGSTYATYAYDASAGISGFTQVNLKGRLSSASRSGTGVASNTAFSYDGAGRVAQLEECTPSQCGTSTYRSLAYTYDYAGNMLTSTDGNGTTSTYTVSQANELMTLSSSKSGTYNPSAIISSMNNGPNGPTTYNVGASTTHLYNVNTYDSVGRMNGGYVCLNSTSISCSGGTQQYGFSTVWTGAYLTSFCDTVLNVCGTSSFDDFGRLSSQSAPAYTFTYDRFGNRLTQTPSGGGSTFDATVNPATNQLTNTGMTYDAAGNMTSDGTGTGSHTYSYDPEGRVVSVDGGTDQYIYDALNHRVRTVIGTTANEFTFNAAGQRVAEWTGTTSGADNTFVQGKYYWGATPVAYYDSTYTYFEHQDWMGTERARTTYNGGVEGTFTSLPFGDDLATASGADNDANHYGMLDRDYETETEHAQFRQYQSAQGHWLSPDPYYGSYDASNPQSFNRYVYVLNNPLSFVDPSGLDLWGGDPGGANDPNCSSGSVNCGGGSAGAGGGGSLWGISSQNEAGWVGSGSIGWYTVNVGGDTMLAVPVVPILLFANPFYIETDLNPDDDNPEFIELETSGWLDLGAANSFNYSSTSFSWIGGAGPAPSKPTPQKPGFWSCTFTGKVGMSIGTTTLDAVGIIPGGGNVLHGIQFGAAIIGAGISVYGSIGDAGLSATGVGLALADKGGASIAIHGTEMIPVVGNIVSAGATLHDIFGGEGLIANYKGCMAGTHP